MEEDNNNSPEQHVGDADLYALGMMSPTEIAEFEARVLAGKVDQGELDDSLQTLTALCEEMSGVMPTPRKAVKAALMAFITSGDAPSAPAPPTGQMFLHANEGEWQELVPGISIRVLHDDQEHGRTMFLARLEAGAQYPSHRHMGLEECLVLQGDLVVDGTTLRDGDFTASYYNKVHIDTHSNDGCLLLITSPMNDEFLDMGSSAAP